MDGTPIIFIWIPQLFPTLDETIYCLDLTKIYLKQPPQKVGFKTLNYGNTGGMIGGKQKENQM